MALSGADLLPTPPFLPRTDGAPPPSPWVPPTSGKPQNQVGEALSLELLPGTRRDAAPGGTRRLPFATVFLPRSRLLEGLAWEAAPTEGARWFQGSGGPLQP